MATRKEIRDAVAAALTTAMDTLNPNIKVHAFKKPVHETDDPFVCVYLEQGTLENGVGFAENQAELTLYILHPDETDVDDTLDQIGNASIDGLTGFIPTLNSMHTAWQYVRDEHPGWTGLRLTYQLFD